MKEFEIKEANIAPYDMEEEEQLSENDDVLFENEDFEKDSSGGMFEHYRFNVDKGQSLLRIDKYITEHMEKTRQSHREVWYRYAQKLYISKIVENYHYLNQASQKEVKAKLKKQMKSFLKSPQFGMPVKAKYMLASMFPKWYGSRRAKKAPVEQYFD